MPNAHLQNVGTCHVKNVDIGVVWAQWRRHGGGASGATCPPPQPPIGHPVRSMQIRGDFRVRKNGVGLQGLLRSFTCTDATADVLWSYDYEKEGVVEVVEGVALVGPR